MAEFRSDLIQRVRKIVSVQNQNHSWASLTDEELLKSARLYQQDFQTGKYGFTLASVLLLGKDDVILSVVPHHRTDAILRRVNTDRYDDRDLITTNFIESYDRLMVFVEKHLPDPFYMEGTSRISIRAHIFREIIVNSLIHREYLNAYPARLIIEADQISLENSNRPHGYGLINLTNSIPFPKNPIIASFFRQINLAEELGSGFKKLAKYGKSYFGAKPIVQEKDIFRFEAPYPNAVRDQRRVAAAGVESGVESEIAYKILILLQKATFGKKEIAQKLGKEKPSRYLNELTAELLTKGFIEYVIPGKPNSRLQRYRITAKGKAVVNSRKGK